MEHKMLVAASLREGLAKIRQHCKDQVLANPLHEQWEYLAQKLNRGLDFHPNKTLIENNFAYESVKLLRRVRGD